MFIINGAKRTSCKSEFPDYKKYRDWITFYFIPVIPIVDHYVPNVSNKTYVILPIFWSNFILNFIMCCGLVSILGVWKWIAFIFCVTMVLMAVLGEKPSLPMLFGGYLFFSILSQAYLIYTIEERRARLR